jgi:hypothetical protein
VPLGYNVCNWAAAWCRVNGVVKEWVGLQSCTGWSANLTHEKSTTFPFHVFVARVLRNGIETMVFMVMHLFNGTFRIKHLGIVALAENEEDDARTQREREEILSENCYK